MPGTEREESRRRYAQLAMQSKIVAGIGLAPRVIQQRLHYIDAKITDVEPDWLASLTDVRCRSEIDQKHLIAQPTMTENVEFDFADFVI